MAIAAQQEDQTPAASSEAAGDLRVIQSISVIGSERLEAGTILSYVRLRVGQTYTVALGDEALKDLAATGLFADFSIRFERGVITLTLTENPVINRILLEGNKRIKQDKILPEIKLAPRQIFTRSKVRADVNRIIELYKRQGRFAATVEPKLVELPQNRIDVVFEIREGPKSKVRKINVIGNAVFNDETIKEQMVTRESRAKNLLSSNTSYDPDRLAFDQQKLRQFYLTEGHADFRVVSAVAELTPDQRDFIITYVVEEGERYRFGDVSTRVELRDFDEELLGKRLPMQASDWYDAKLVEDTVEQLGELAGTYGYAFTDVQPRFTRNREARTMDIAFVLRQTPRVYVERIDVNGNTLTRDKVIRREFRLAEGDAFNSLALRQSSNRIRSLGYFQENFEIEQKQGSGPDRIVLEANVEERPTGELEFSAGFSSVENLILAASVRQRNFGGRGQTVGLGVNYSGASQSAQFSFTEPFLWDRNISFGFNLYQQNYDDGFFRDGDTSYEQSTTGGSFRFGAPLTDYSLLILGYTLNFERVTLDENVFFADLDGDGVDTCEPLLAGRFICDALGDRTVSIGSLSYIFSNLDNNFRPTRGLRYSVTGEVAGLGGSVSYLRFRGRAASFWNLGGGLIASAQAEGGYIHSLDEEETRLTDRFFLGDPQFRGFDIRGLGLAIERVTLIADENGDEEDGPTSREALGGNAYYLGRLELELPLLNGARELGLRPSLFLDVGSVFSLNEPQLSQSPFPDGAFIATRDDEGRALYSQTFDVDGDGLVETVTTISPIAPDGTANSALGSMIAPFREDYVGDTWRPRMTAGVGVNWNSPFGPFRLDLAFPILTEESDETQLFSFNVGTQF
ncbi:outer membrane protein assembly factor BamA [Erythrobacter sp. YT30]|uniref:outer membrane protein assembly factor BamA n=1 Tax=Erythrobacter sp. YT30 TaxID=1735012 RepID=UPI001F1DED41|nr:outer membrane protein assembly factor BamA [Erythrobacter sp. YT30]